jgi:hypothetical protein
MDISTIEAAQEENKPPCGLDIADPDTREFVDHLLALIALEYVQRMRCTSDPKDLTAWELPIETMDPRRNRE